MNVLYETGRPWCWACGADPPLERAHLSAGGGRQVRKEDRRGVVLLCRDCHLIHIHDKKYHDWPEALVPEDCITDAGMLWIKRERDPQYYDPEWIKSVWIGNPPDPAEPVWLRDVYERRRGT